MKFHHLISRLILKMILLLWFRTLLVKTSKRSRYKRLCAFIQEKLKKFHSFN